MLRLILFLSLIIGLHSESLIKVAKKNSKKLTAKKTTVYSNKDLDCNFGSKCCWKNSKGKDPYGFPLDDFDFVIGTQKLPSSSKDYFKTKSLPKPKYLLFTMKVKDPIEDVFKTVTLESCRIKCIEKEVTMKLKVWYDGIVFIDVCQETAHESLLVFCVSVESSGTKDRPIEHTLKIPAQRDPHKLIITISNFENDDNVVIIDDIKFSGGKYCPNPKPKTTLAPTTLLTTPAMPATERPYKNPFELGKIFKEACDAVTCSFNQIHQAGDRSRICGYTNINAAQFDIHYGKLGSGASGIHAGPTPNEYYGYALLGPKQEAVMVSKNFTLTEDAELRFLYYESNHKTKLSVCVNTEDHCIKRIKPSKSGEVAKWKTGRVTLKVKDKYERVYIKAKNTRSTTTIVVGIDDIQIYTTKDEYIYCPRL